MTDKLRVPLEFSPNPSDPSSIGIDRPTLEYTVKPVEAKQTRFVARLLLEPQINLSEYICRATVDFVDVAVEVGRPTQGRHISDYLAIHLARRPYVDAINDSSTRFSITIQEPSLSTVLAVEGLIKSKYGLVKPATIYTLEVSIDWYPKSTSNEDRWKMVAVLQRHFLSKALKFENDDDYPRFAWGPVDIGYD